VITGTLSDLGKVIAGRPLADKARPVTYTGLSIDTRTLVRENLFVAIKGESDDGHKYIAQAQSSGAAAYIIQSGYEAHVPAEIKECTLVVEDTHKALRDISFWWRKKFNPKIIAVTGTNGKTTTKEMIADLLSGNYRVFRSPGNFNNLYGIPLSLCLLDDSYEVCVLELGMSYPGEIAILTKIVRPDIALITNVGPAHLETMGSLENIAKAKFELFENSAESTLRILNLDDPLLARRYELEDGPRLGFAVYSEADVRPSGFSANSMGRMIFDYADQNIHLQVSGLHNLYNALAACAVGKAFNLETATIKSALENFRAKSSRMQIINLKDIVIIDDSYNANPTSMGYALKVLHDMRVEGRRIAVLGDMKELGKDEVGLHQEIGRIIAELKPDILVTVGKLGMHIASQANLEGYDSLSTRTYISAAEAAEFLISELRSGDHVLIKASRAMGFDKIVTELGKYLGEEN
jgi:UDP-N-acetylmuramoyl-tripeptide--D-alanyl-D-alanine ligase